MDNAHVTIIFEIKFSTTCILNNISFIKDVSKIYSDLENSFLNRYYAELSFLRQIVYTSMV
jgi:hypothetical protein